MYTFHKKVQPSWQPSRPILKQLAVAHPIIEAVFAFYCALIHAAEEDVALVAVVELDLIAAFAEDFLHFIGTEHGVALPFIW